MARVAKTKPKVKPVQDAVPVEKAPIISEFAVGDRITHGLFGDGDVTGVRDNTLTIQFKKFGSKEILDGFVKRSA